jgi:hypothetical protein
MGEGTTGLSAEAPRESALQLDADIGRLRQELGGLVGELDRRRHELLDVRLQVKRHAVAATVTGASLVAVAAGLVWLGIWHQRRQQGAMSRGGRLREALSRAIDRPERVASQPTIAERIVGGVLTAAAAAVVKKVLERALRAALEQRRGTAMATPPAGALPSAASAVHWPARAPAVIGAPATENPS